ncbi:MAG: protein-methionine-sulfoxide reductase heme-binding subunit MsrQ [Paracoccaceae bacterium]|jgi:methionine sulfoxide reductase heme-binding subunit|nr:MAG: sulfite oxidase [Rhodobacter sp. BACL10 MAG-120910-bin24]MDO7654221.1 protein-methionine-sulfoxide reductase heme-binding subunit MsrQ [Paracoccaceae bacterium]MDO7658384.1 protein-methionine-sulfoxide reductase heme-binding subunit MsrQ [Paracoccaceae bacterium]
MLSALHNWVRRVPVWSVYLVLAIPAVYFFYLALTGALSIEPIKALEHKLGEFGLQLLIFGLFITPLRRYLGLNLLRFRRAIGVMTYYYITLHLLVWLILDVQVPSAILQDIVKRPYITIGMLAFVGMTPLAFTSNSYAVRKLGQSWRKLHRLVYVIAVLGAVHFIMLVKGLQFEPIIYLGVILTLLALRLKS